MDDEITVRRVCFDVKIAVRSFDECNSFSSNRQARKASASSRESAEMTNGLLTGLLSHSLKISWYAMIDGAKISGVRCGSLAFAPSFPCLLKCLVAIDW